MATAGEDRKRLFGWLSLEMAMVLIVQVVTLTLCYASLKSDIRNAATVSHQQDKRIEQLETNRDSDRKLLMEMNGKIEVLLERTKPRQP